MSEPDDLKEIRRESMAEEVIMDKILTKIIACLGILIGILIFLAGIGNILLAFYSMYLSWHLVPIHGLWGWLVLQGISFFGIIWGLLLVYIGNRLVRLAWVWGEFKG